MIRLSHNGEDVLKQLEEVKKELTRKLTATVKIYAYQYALESVLATPLGDIEKYYNFYKTRPIDTLSRFNLSKAPGNARGGWQLTFNELPANKYPGFADDGSFMRTQFKKSADDYKLGETIYVTNYIPYVANDDFYVPGWKSLQSGERSDQARGGIVDPVRDIMNIFKQDLQKIYDRS